MHSICKWIALCDHSDLCSSNGENVHRLKRLVLSELSQIADRVPFYYQTIAFFHRTSITTSGSLVQFTSKQKPDAFEALASKFELEERNSYLHSESHRSAIVWRTNGGAPACALEPDRSWCTLDCRPAGCTQRSPHRKQLCG